MHKYNYSNSNPDARILVNAASLLPLMKDSLLEIVEWSFYSIYWKENTYIYNLIFFAFDESFNLLQSQCKANKRGNQTVSKKSRSYQVKDYRVLKFSWEDQENNFSPYKYQYSNEVEQIL